MWSLFLLLTISLILFKFVVLEYSHHQCLKDWQICDLFSNENKCCSKYCRKDHTSPVPQCYPSNVNIKCHSNGDNCNDNSNCCSKVCIKKGWGWMKGKCQSGKPLALINLRASTTTTTTLSSTTIRTVPTTTTTTPLPTTNSTPTCYDNSVKCQNDDECCSEYCFKKPQLKEGVCQILDINPA